MTETATQGKHFTQYAALGEQAEYHETQARHHTDIAQDLRRRSYCDNCWDVLEASDKANSVWANAAGSQYDEAKYDRLQQATQELRAKPCQCGRRDPAKMQNK